MARKYTKKQLFDSLAKNGTPDRRQPTAEKAPELAPDKSLARSHQPYHLFNTHGWLLVYTPSGLHTTVTRYFHGTEIDRKDMLTVDARKHAAAQKRAGMVEVTPL